MVISNCCNHSNKSKKCIRKKDNKAFTLPRRFSRKQCKNPKGYSMRSSCAPYNNCFKGGKSKQELNIENKILEPCSFKPLTGYTRDGYCRTNETDTGNHLVCAKIDKKFLEFTKSRGNDLTSVVKPNDSWCICQKRYEEAFNNNKHPDVIISATNNKISSSVKKILNTIKNKKGGKRKTKKQFLYNPNDPKKSFDVYIDKDPSDTIPIKYTSIEDIKKTIRNLERLYKNKKYSHKRIWQVGMILKLRLEALKKHHKTRYKKAKNVNSRFKLAEKYFNFLSNRTKKDEKERYKMVFKI